MLWESGRKERAQVRQVRRGAGPSGEEQRALGVRVGWSPGWFTESRRVLPVREANATSEGRKQAFRGAPKVQARGAPRQPHPVPAPEKPPKFAAPWTLFTNLGPSSPTGLVRDAGPAGPRSGRA